MGLSPRISVGLPPNVKARPRADFQREEFDQAIITKGYRVWWSRAALCPCANNDQTEQADPTCPLCRGHGWIYFLPDPAIRAGTAVDVFGHEVEVSPEGDAIMIQAIMMAFTNDLQIFEKFGEWAFGVSRATVQPENCLGYRDRLRAVDSVMPWAQHIEYGGGTEIAVTGGYDKSGLRYPFLSVNYFRDVETVYREGLHFELTADGAIRWLGTPPSARRLSIHGTVRPVWLCLDHMHLYRDSLAENKGADPCVRLPIQMAVKLDFLIEA